MQIVPDDLQAVVALAIVVLVFVGFIRERLPPPVVATTAAAAFLALGFLSVKDALQVFSNSAPITIAAMFIVSGALVRTGALEAAVAVLLKVGEARPRRAIVMLFGGAFIASALMNNTVVIIVLIPVVTVVTSQLGWSKKRLLMPLSFVAILGGTTTLLGTSSNLIVDGVARQAGKEGFNVFDITLVGLAASAAGFVTLLALNRLLARENDEGGSDVSYAPNRILTRLRVKEGAEIAGLRLQEIRAFTSLGVSLLEIARGARRIKPCPDIVIEEGDSLDARLSETELMTLLADDNFDGGFSARALTSEMTELAAITISPDNFDVGKELKNTHLVSRYPVSIVGASRPGRLAGPSIRSMTLRAGDRIYVRAAPQTVRALRDASFIVSTRQLMARAFRRDRLLVASGVLVAIVALAALGVMPIAGLAMIGAAALLLLRCIEPSEAWHSFDGDVLVTIFAMLMIGSGLQNTGAVSLIVSAIEPVLLDAAPLAVIFGLYLLTSSLTEVVTNNAVAVIMTPIAIGLADSIGADVRTFVVTVMFAASASFATPIGYQTNMLVYSAGDYRFVDFLRVGLPMNVVVGTASCMAIYVLF